MIEVPLAECMSLRVPPRIPEAVRAGNVQQTGYEGAGGRNRLRRVISAMMSANLSRRDTAMERNPSVDEVAEHFTEYLNRVADHGEHFVLTRETEPVAELRPVPRPRRLAEMPALLRAFPPLSPAVIRMAPAVRTTLCCPARS